MIASMPVIQLEKYETYDNFISDLLNDDKTENENAANSHLDNTDDDKSGQDEFAKASTNSDEKISYADDFQVEENTVDDQLVPSEAKDDDNDDDTTVVENQEQQNDNVDNNESPMEEQSNADNEQKQHDDNQSLQDARRVQKK